MRRLFALIAAFALLTGACTDGGAGETTTTTGTTPESSTTTTAAAPATTTTLPQVLIAAGPRPVEPFAEFTPVALFTDSPPYQGPATPHSIEGIFVPPTVEYDLTPQVVGALEQQGFAVVPGFARLFHPVYQTFPYQGEVYFVTTDAAYHYLHLGFSKILRELEQDQLLPILEGLVTGLVDASRDQAVDLARTPLADAADRVAQFYEAAAVLLDLDVGEIGPLAEEEVALAREAASLDESPITGLCPGDPEQSMSCLVDFSLFKPRGHYTRNADLERYFRSMSLLGNENFSVGYPETMTLAVLATRLLVSDPALLEAWQLIYEPTAFLVGMADDYTPVELADQLDDLAPGWRDDPSAITETVAGAAGEGLIALRPVGIDPEAASVRIMGVRLVVDSYIYDQLRFPSVGDPPFGRIYATPLDLVATFGSDLAYEILAVEEVPFQTGESVGAIYLTDPGTGEHWTNHDSQLEKLSGMISTREPSHWGATVYDAWLYALEPVWSPLGEAYPDFMRSRAWEIKDLQTGLGSYTELKHDTILYAKQSFAAEGDFQPVEYPEPRHWVEPNPVAFQRMTSVIGLLEDGLTQRGLLPAGSDNAALITALDDFIGRLGRLAADELAAEPISAEDNDWLGAIGSTMEALWIRSSDEVEEATGEFPDQDLNSALVADIMRTTYEVLEIGTGNVDSVYVLVPTDEGRFQIAKGAVYSYYEFWRPSDEGRLTDEEWWSLLESNPPERPDWQSPLFSAEVSYDTGLEPGLTCADLAGAVDGYEDVLAYWIASQQPGQLDSDGNGLPCDRTPMYDADVFADLREESDLFCRDLVADGFDFADAVAYWVREGTPSRMDADHNGIPCETVFSSEEVEAFFDLAR
ncbi:MAG: DUF3160 domain-containing protein [Acidimicrobiia bacterium]